MVPLSIIEVLVGVQVGGNAEEMHAQAAVRCPAHAEGGAAEQGGTVKKSAAALEPCLDREVSHSHLHWRLHGSICAVEVHSIALNARVDGEGLWLLCEHHSHYLFHAGQATALLADCITEKDLLRGAQVVHILQAVPDGGHVAVLRRNYHARGGDRCPQVWLGAVFWAGLVKAANLGEGGHVEGNVVTVRIVPRKGDFIKGNIAGIAG
mmetsp:Transcript_8239/g.23659  ORF Transcript_8239/g.23659 Transcript_8239/m.23659 type:complete len:208 (+) Transcript_8239:4640-5263(+)